MKLSIYGLAIAMSLATAQLNAQKDTKAYVAGTAVDERYGHTTVIYKKTNATATDSDILASMGDDFSMGDVVRIAVAPPKPKVAPAAALESSPIRSVAAMSTPATMTKAPTAATTPVAKPAAPKTTTAVKAPTAATTPVAKPAAPKTTTTANTPTATTPPVAKPTAPKTTAAVNIQNVVKPASPKTTTTTVAKTAAPQKMSTASGSARKAGAYKSGKKHKSGFHFGKAKKSKSAKKGRQRYHCYKF